MFFAVFVLTKGTAKDIFLHGMGMVLNLARKRD